MNDAVKKAIRKNDNFDIDFYTIYDWFGFNESMTDVRESMVNFLVTNKNGMENDKHFKIEQRYICSKKLETPWFSNAGFKILCHVYDYPNKKEIVKIITGLIL